MSNTLLTISDITNEALAVLENELTFTKRVNREYDDKFAQAGAKIGSTVNIRKPVRFTRTTGQGLQLQDITENSVPLTLTTQYQKAFTFSSADLALSADDFSRRYIRPAIISMANDIDYDGLSQYINVANYVGTAGSDPSAVLTFLNAGVLMDNEAAPMGDRSLCINPSMQATVVDTIKGLFNPQAVIGPSAEKGMIAKYFLGMDWYMDQNVRRHTSGAQGGTPLMNGATVDGATSLVTDGWTASVTNVLVQGDVISVANVNQVNPQNRQATGKPRYFVVTANVSSDGSGNATIPVSPCSGNGTIQSSGQYQNVDALPADNAAITVFSAASTASAQGLAFDRDAFTFACVDLELPGGVDMAKRVSDKQLGMSIRAVRAYDINLDRWPLRLDLLGGFATIYPELACRVLGA